MAHNTLSLFPSQNSPPLQTHSNFQQDSCRTLISDLSFFGLREVGDLQSQWQLPLAKSPLFFVSKGLPNYFGRLCYVMTYFTFVSSSSKNSTSSSSSMTILKNNPSSNNVKFRAFFNIQEKYLKPIILGFLLKTQTLTSGMLGLPSALS